VSVKEARDLSQEAMALTIAVAIIITDWANVQPPTFLHYFNRLSARVFADDCSLSRGSNRAELIQRLIPQPPAPRPSRSCANNYPWPARDPTPHQCPITRPAMIEHSVDMMRPLGFALGQG